MLHAVNHDLPDCRLWCGPAAIAAVTGQPTSVIHEAIKQDRGDRAPVRGVFPGELARVMARLGYAITVQAECQGLDVQAFCKVFAPMSQAVPLIAATADHYFVLAQGLFLDNGTRWPIEPELAHARGTVVEALGFKLVREPDIPTPPATPPDAALLAKARRLARKHGIVVESLGPGRCWQVWCPELDHDDPFEDENTVDSGAAALRLVERYVHCLESGYLEAVTDPALLPHHAGA